MLYAFKMHKKYHCIDNPNRLTWTGDKRKKAWRHPSFETRPCGPMQLIIQDAPFHKAREENYILQQTLSIFNAQMIIPEQMVQVEY